MAREPIRPPQYKVVEPTLWYCLHCELGAKTDEQFARAHYQSHHATAKDDLPSYGDDYVRGGELLGLAFAWQQWAARETDRFGKYAVALRGVDDFLLECGHA